MMISAISVSFPRSLKGSCLSWKKKKHTHTTTFSNGDMKPRFYSFGYNEKRKTTIRVLE